MADIFQLATYQVDGEKHFGLLGPKGVADLSPHLHDCATLDDAVAQGRLAALLDFGARRSPDHAEKDVSFHPPLARPGKIICVGVNYPERNEEYRDGAAAPAYPSLFPRFAQGFVGHGRNLIRPPESATLDYEGEIVLVIGKAGRRIVERDALDHVAAVTLANEGTIRDWVRHGKFNVTQGKNFDRSASLGPGLTPFADEAQIADIRLETRVNGELRQSDRTSRMMFPFRRLIAYISTFATLDPGDIIITGTPTGAGARLDPPVYLKPGDQIEVSAEGLRSLINGVENEALA